MHRSAGLRGTERAAITMVPANATDLQCQDAVEETASQQSVRCETSTLCRVRDHHASSSRLPWCSPKGRTIQGNHSNHLSRRLDGRRLRPDTVLLIDEAGMAGTRISAEILRHVERTGVKVIAVGDSGQLTSVQAGGWFAALTRQQSGPELREVLRQRDPAEREALAALHDGRPDVYLEHKGEQITLHATERDAVKAVVGAWVHARAEQPSADVVMIARDNETREQLNRAARVRLQERGETHRARPESPQAAATPTPPRSRRPVRWIPSSWRSSCP